MSLVSIIIPIFNRSKFLAKCIDSILSQTYKDFQLILVDDGSTDGSENICDSYAKQDNRISVIHQKNSGVVAARKIGISQATGEYIAFVDSDDWVDSCMYEILMSKAIETNADIVFCDYNLVEDDISQRITINFSSSPSQMLQYLLQNKNGGYLWNKLWKRNIASKCIMDCFDHHNIYEDIWASAQSFMMNPQISYVPDALYNYNHEKHLCLTMDSSIQSQGTIYFESIFHLLYSRSDLRSLLSDMVYSPFRFKFIPLNRGEIQKSIQMYSYTNKVKECYRFLPCSIRWIYWALFNWGFVGLFIYKIYRFVKL